MIITMRVECYVGTSFFVNRWQHNPIVIIVELLMGILWYEAGQISIITEVVWHNVRSDLATKFLCRK